MIKTNLKRWLALSVPIVLLAFVLYKTGCYFETNDDRYIVSILSGVVTGSPDARVKLVNYWLSFPLMLLYQITTKVPWYGGMMLLFQWLIYASVLNSAYSRCQKWVQVVPITVLISSFFLAYYYVAGMVEFTSTAAMLASAGYAGFLLHKDEKKGFAFFCVLELLGFLLRSHAMLMIQPLGLAAVLVVVLGEKAEWKEVVKKLLPVAAALVFILCFGMVGNIIGYHGEEWKRHNQFNDMRIALFDYYGAPAYEEVDSILEEYGVSKEKYEALCAYMILDWNTDAECDKKLQAYAESKEQKEFRIGELLEEVYDLSLAPSQWNVHRMTIAAWSIFLLWMLVKRNWKMLCMGIVFLGGARLAVWLYLVWVGRIPVRVLLPLLACETLLLLVLVWVDCQKTDAAQWKTVVLVVGGVMFCMVGISSGRQQCRYIKEMNGGQLIYMEGLREIQEYCGERAQNRYLIDSSSLNSYKGSVLETSIYHPVNAVISGGWFSMMPAVRERLEDYLGNVEGFYFLIYADGSQEQNPAFVYLAAEMGGRPRLVEQWTASHGGSYAVYYFEGAFPFHTSQ